MKTNKFELVATQMFKELQLLWFETITKEDILEALPILIKNHDR